MRGYIRKKGEHSWQITIDTGTGPNGERRRAYETVRGWEEGCTTPTSRAVSQLREGRL